MHRKLAIAFYLVLLATTVFSLRGALFRSGRSFRFRQSRVAEHEAPVETKRSVVMYPGNSMEASDNQEANLRLLSNYLLSRV
ncbi:hypothetical protein Y032_0437g1450 [Ancylostoma ceylanicum]|uniref:Uncharacterized protein n=1 Tax=Ancylostoma ceylanicum TaxID=53326 RepID=A0A016WZW7_9BILA|nr:hypothetical protein Y032_0437g1450 [Ancylostoma ceylanicum]